MLPQELDVQEELPTHGNDAHIFLEHGIAAGLAEAGRGKGPIDFVESCQRLQTH